MTTYYCIVCCGCNEYVESHGSDGWLNRPMETLSFILKHSDCSADRGDTIKILPSCFSKKKFKRYIPDIKYFPNHFGWDKTYENDTRWNWKQLKKRIDSNEE